MSFDDDGSPPPDGTTDNPFPPYDLTKVAHPPSIARLYGYSSESLQRLIHHRLTLTSQHLHRPLTTPETEALVFWTARNYTIGSYGPLLGTAGGIAVAIQMRKSMGFPFYMPGAGASAGMKAGRVLGQEMGRGGVLGWHAARVLAYGLFGSWIGRVVVGGYAVGVTVAGESGDERLRGVLEEVGKGRRRAGKKNSAGIDGNAAAASPPDTMYSEGVPAQDRQQQQQQQQPQRTPWLSPSPQTQTPPPPPPPPPPDYSPTDPSLDSGDRLLSDNEISLQGSHTPKQPTPPTPQTATATTWSLIRASALSSSTQPPKPTSTSSWQRARESQSRSGEGGEEAERDAERSREDAQREFDERVERERSGVWEEKGKGRGRWGD